MESDEYEVVCDRKPTPEKRASTLPTPIKGSAGGRLPPPKPDGAQLTRLSLIEDDYAYSPVLVTAPGSSRSLPRNTKMVPPPKPDQSKLTRLPSLDVEYSRPPPLANSDNDVCIESDICNSLPDVESFSSPSQVPWIILNNNKLEQCKVPSIYVESEPNGVGQGKVYEEVLIKPSQLKGLDNAQVRKPK